LRFICSYFITTVKPCQRDGHRHKDVRHLEGDSTLERAYYVCPTCPDQTLFSLSATKLRLRLDQVSPGLARVAVRDGLQVAERRAAEAERANQVAQRSERPNERRLAMEGAVGEQGNVSTDGAMVLIRKEG
jgi:hypothetical protein